MVLSYTAGNKPIDYATFNVCNTDYKLQLIECNEYDLALVITRWINLGPGLSRDDPQWTDHEYESLIRHSPSMDTRIPSISPLSVFEAAVTKDWSVETLCSYNLSFLWNRQYKILMQPKCFLRDTIWFLSPQRHMERQGISIRRWGPMMLLPCQEQKVECTLSSFPLPCYTQRLYNNHSYKWITYIFIDGLLY